MKHVFTILLLCALAGCSTTQPTAVPKTVQSVPTKTNAPSGPPPLPSGVVRSESMQLPVTVTSAAKPPHIVHNPPYTPTNVFQLTFWFHNPEYINRGWVEGATNISGPWTNVWTAELWPGHYETNTLFITNIATHQPSQQFYRVRMGVAAGFPGGGTCGFGVAPLGT